MRLFGKWRVLFEGDEKVLDIFPSRRKGLNYLLNRLFEGETVADGALEHHGIKVRLLRENDEVITVPPEEASE